MNTPATLGAFMLGLVAVFGAAAGVGNAVGPVGPDEASHGSEPHAEDGAAERGAQDAQTDAMPADLPGGVLVSQDGYTFDPDAADLPAGAATPLSFRIIGPGGQALTGYEISHDEEMHLIAVRRDMTGFQHVHPELGDDGRWSVPLELTAGSWRLFADFDPAGPDEPLTLGSDLAVAGQYTPEPLPGPSPTAEVDGYTVALDGELVPGAASELTLTVSRGGEPVTDLQPYLAAYGHLVALRDGDLAYLHVHPGGEPGDGTTRPGPDITFHVTAPSAGDYRLFLDFRHGDVVRTAEFTVRAGGAAVPDTSGTGNGSTDDGHGDG